MKQNKSFKVSFERCKTRWESNVQWYGVPNKWCTDTESTLAHGCADSGLQQQELVRWPQQTRGSSCQTCRWNRDTGSYHSRTQKPALASDQVTHTVQTVRAYAPGAHRSQSCLPGWHDDSHRRSTRSWETSVRQHFRYETPKLKLKFGERGFSYTGPKAWNSPPSNLQELTNTDTFEKQLKTHRSV